MKSKSDFSLFQLQKLLQKIPKGKVVTYGELARALGNSKASRAAGTLCGKNPEPNTYPCYKVVRSNGVIGKFAFGTADKVRRLKEDAIEVKNGKIVNFEKYNYFFPQE